MGSTRYWKCRRQINGHVCGTSNPKVKQKCVECGGPRPASRRAAHLKALDTPYEFYVELTGGERCAICQRPPSALRRLDRDHDHKTGQPRGLLCIRCNRALAAWVTPSWLRAAADYLERTASVA